ncbi:hypothetical protein PspLS_03991 [Pyricularia sp. CBS 133598]|nr:hypothetical protein PspLS_03991 [Pyricularia sp. CBS 133598]
MLVLKQIVFLLLPLVSHLATAYPVSAQDRPVTARELVRHGAASADESHHLQRRTETKSRWSSSSSSGRSSSDGEVAGSPRSGGSQKTEASRILNEHVGIAFDAGSLLDQPASPRPNPSNPPNLNKPLPQIPSGQASSSSNPAGVGSSGVGALKPKKSTSLFPKLGSKNPQSNMMAAQSAKTPIIGKPTLTQSSTGFAAADSREPVPKTKSKQTLRKSASKQSLKQDSSGPAGAGKGKGKKSEGGFF